MRNVCVIEGCGRVRHGFGYCARHYQRLRQGVPLDQPWRPAGGQWGVWRVNYQGYVSRRRETRKDGVRIREEQFQHRFVMEQLLGRELLPTETVHHKNGIKTDNDPSNLELWSTSQPYGQRVEDKVMWARAILRLYGEQY